MLLLLSRSCDLSYCSYCTDDEPGDSASELSKTTSEGFRKTVIVPVVRAEAKIFTANIITV